MPQIVCCRIIKKIITKDLVNSNSNFWRLWCREQVINWWQRKTKQKQVFCKGFVKIDLNCTEQYLFWFQIFGNVWVLDTLTVTLRTILTHYFQSDKLCWLTEEKVGSWLSPFKQKSIKKIKQIFFLVKYSKWLHRKKAIILAWRCVMTFKKFVEWQNWKKSSNTSVWISISKQKTQLL